MSQLATKIHNHDQRLTTLHVIGRRQDAIQTEGGIRFWNDDEGISMKLANSNAEAAAQGVFSGGVYRDCTGQVKIRTDEDGSPEPPTDCNIYLEPGDDLGEAIKSLAELEGSVNSVTINLAPGEYDAPVCTGLDLDMALTILGDSRGEVGMSWVHGAQTDGVVRQLQFPGLDPEFLKLGRGQNVELDIIGDTVTVSFANDATILPSNGANVSIIQPDFSDLVAGDICYITDASGAMTPHTVTSVAGNTITFNAAVGIVMANGVALTIVPNVKIAGSEGAISGVKHFRFVGCHIDVTGNPGFNLDSHDGGLEHCVSGNMINSQSMYCPRPNTWLGLLTNLEGSQFNGVWQATLGTDAATHFSGNAASSFVGSVWSGCHLDTGAMGTNAFTTINCGKIATPFCDFFNCPRGIAATNSHLNLQNVVFDSNTTGLYMEFGCRAISRPLPLMSLTDTAPSFTNNVTGLSINDSSVAVLDGTNFAGNGVNVRVDGLIIPNNTYGPRFSLVKY